MRSGQAKVKTAGRVIRITKVEGVISGKIVGKVDCIVAHDKRWYRVAFRSELAMELGKKGAAERYAAFLEMTPSLVAREARHLSGPQRERALEAYTKARELSAIAPRLSLDPAATVFQLGGLFDQVARPLP